MKELVMTRCGGRDIGGVEVGIIEYWIGKYQKYIIG
jgi:hypothetical protein